VASPDRAVAVTRPPTLADLAADPGELDVTCLDCHHNTTMPVAALLPRYAAETPFPEVWGGFRCSACGSRRIDVRPHWAARQAAGQITPPEGTI
jgi:hypothetical protein